MKYTTNYLTAIQWLNRDLILQNDIAEIDPSVWDNITDAYNEETGELPYIFQWYITNFTEEECDWMKKHFERIYFTHSDLLDKNILLVDHWGTSWNYVMIKTDIENAARKEGEKK